MRGNGCAASLVVTSSSRFGNVPRSCWRRPRAWLPADRAGVAHRREPGASGDRRVQRRRDGQPPRTGGRQPRKVRHRRPSSMLLWPVPAISANRGRAGLCGGCAASWSAPRWWRRSRSSTAPAPHKHESADGSPLLDAPPGSWVTAPFPATHASSPVPITPRAYGSTTSASTVPQPRRRPGLVSDAAAAPARCSNDVPASGNSLPRLPPVGSTPPSTAAAPTPTPPSTP
jgi:hypothetical protein